MTGEKRPFPDDGLAHDDTKRVRSNNPSPVPPANDDIERKKREAAERIAAIKAKMANATGQGQSPKVNAPSPSPVTAARSAAQSAADRIAAMKARMSNGPGQSASAAVATAPAPSSSSSSSSSSAATSGAISAAERIAAMKARINGQAAPAPAAPAQAASLPSSSAPDNNKQAEIQARLLAMRSRLQAPAASPSPPPPSDINERMAAAKAKALEISQQRRGPAPLPPVREDSILKSRGGLNVGIHPSLLQQHDQGPSRGPQKGKRGQENRQKSNPYLDDATNPAEVGAARKADPSYDASLTTSTTAGKTRKSRQLLFNQKGKFIAQANALRQQEKLEEMRLRMQEESRKKAIEEATEKSYLVPAPPEVEWWDEALLAEPNYDTLDVNNAATLKFDVVTPYVQHPVLLAAPQESRMPAAKPMFLTKEEQKKVRRQRRMANHKEEQAKIRLGLRAPPPPKVKKSNLMRVLGQEAVKDPTAVEARVNREIAQRAADHEATNDERALTKEQRHEKLAQQQEADAAKGVYVCVFRIDNLSYGKHRFQVSKNAEQNNLTGMTIFNPKLNLVIVEGGAHSINAYKKLMLNRIRWTENAMPTSVREGNKEAEAEFLRATDERGVLKDLGGNRCQLVFEGEEREKMFKRWFPYRVCETDGEAKDMLSRYKMENMWTLAQSMEGDAFA